MTGLAAIIESWGAVAVVNVAVFLAGEAASLVRRRRATPDGKPLTARERAAFAQIEAGWHLTAGKSRRGERQ